MKPKIIRDPVYDYISIDGDDLWLLDLLDTPEMQRLRYIHQLGVSYLVYPGATHTRFSHSLGVMHLMKEVLRHLQDEKYIKRKTEDRDALLAVAVVHDIGHGPFSHLLESQWGGKHEDWSRRIILDNDSGVNQVLKKKGLVKRVAALLEKEEGGAPSWQRSLISSQLDVDRMDYLMRDSHFTGVGYGKYDYYRLIHTMTIEDAPKQQGQRVPNKHPVWPDKTKYALEEYVFARYYMYHSVYFHPCTRGYEKLLDAIWNRAKDPAITQSLSLLDPIAPFFRTDEKPTVAEYVRLQEYHVLSQIELWKNAQDPVLADLCGMFLARRGFKAIPMPEAITGFAASDKISKAVDILTKAGGNVALAPRCYLLEDKGGVDPYKPYRWSDKEASQPILLRASGKTQEISEVRNRLKSVIEKDDQFARYYCPADQRKPIAAALS
jgi:HD superfamily phosphohydrolase